MKKILLSLLLSFGALLSSGQGFMFLSLDQIKEVVAESEYTIGSGVTEKGIDYITLNDSNFEWVLFFDKNENIVASSKFICKNYDAFIYTLGELTNNGGRLVKTGEGHWIRLLSSGAIDIHTEMTDYSEFPVLYYKYVTY